MDSIKKAYSGVKDRFTEGRGDYPEPGKSGQIACGCDGKEEEKADYIHTLKNDLANTYLWSGNFLKDYFFFIANWHPLLGIFVCHPNHPWGKRERLQMFLISLFLTMPMSVYLGMQAQINHWEKGGPTLTISTLLLVTLPDVIIGVLLYQLSIADTRCPACAGCWDVINKFCMNCFCLIGIISSGFCYLQLKSAPASVHWVKAFHPLVMGKVYSYVTWFPIWFVLPCMGFAHVWYMENKALKKEEEGQALTSDA